MKGVDLFTIEDEMKKSFNVQGKYYDLGYPFNIDNLTSVNNLQSKNFYVRPEYTVRDVKLPDRTKISSKISPMFFELFESKKLKVKEGEEYMNDSANKILNAPKLSSFKVENTKAIELGAENMTEEQFIIRRMEEQNQRDNGVEKDEEFLKKHMHDIYMKRLDDNLQLLRKDLVNKKDKILYSKEYPKIMHSMDDLYYVDGVDYPELIDYVPIKKSEKVEKIEKVEKKIKPNKIPVKSNDVIQTTNIFEKTEAEKDEETERLAILLTPKKTKKEKREEYNSLKKNPESIEINEGLKKIQQDQEEEIQQEIQKNKNTDLVDLERMHPKIRDRLYTILSSSFSTGSISEEIRLQINSYLMSFNKKLLPLNVKKIQTVINVFSKNFMNGQSLNKSESKIQTTENPIFQRRESEFYVSPYKTNK